MFFTKRPPEDKDSIDAMGHRLWVGGLWDEMGEIQFKFLLSQGLKPHHVMLDIACGSLRAGRLLIPYLDLGNYLGIEKHKSILDAGLQHEMDAATLKQRQPEFVISSNFEFDRFSKQPDYCMAQSLFTHLNPQDINRCLEKLATIAKPGCRLYATFFESNWPRLNSIRSSHSHGSFLYTHGQIMEFGTRNGWSSHYIGDWGHPRGQKIVEYRL